MSARKTGLTTTKGYQEPPQYGASIKARSFIDVEGKVFVEVGYLCSSGITTQMVSQIKVEFIGGSDLIVELEEPINGNWLNYQYVPNWEHTANRINRLNGHEGDLGVYSEMMQKRFKTANDQFTMTNKTAFALPCPCKQRVTNKIFSRDPTTHLAIYTFVLEAKSERRNLDVQVEEVFVGGGFPQGGWQGGGGGAAHQQPGGGAHHQGHQQGFAGQPFVNQPGGAAAGGNYPMNQAYMGGVNPGQGVPHFNVYQQPYPNQTPPRQQYAQPPPAQTHFQPHQHPHFTNPPPPPPHPPQNPFPPQPANYHHHHQYQHPPQQPQHQPAVANPNTAYQQQHQPTPPPTTNQPQQQQQAANGTTNYQQPQHPPFFVSPQQHQAAARPINATPTPTPTRQQPDPSPFTQHHQQQQQQQHQPAVSVIPVPAAAATINHPDPAHTPAAVSHAFAPARVATAANNQPPLTDGQKLPPSDNEAIHLQVSNSFFFQSNL